MKPLTCMVLVVAATLTPCLGLASTNDARVLFEKYVGLQQKHDPALADLYSDSARLKMQVKYPDGSTRTNEIPAASFKRIIQTAMDAARREGDSEVYSDTTFKEEKGKVRITTKTTSTPSASERTLTLLVEPSAGGKWQIVEESIGSEAKPFLDQKRSLKPKQEWSREIVSKNAGLLMFRISGPGPFSVSLLSDAAYQALLQKDVAALRKHGMLLTKDHSGPELVNSIRLDAGTYYLITRNNTNADAEFRVQCYSVRER